MSNVIRKGITTTIVYGFVLGADNVPTPTTIELEGALTKERAEGKARKASGNMLITGVEQKRSFFELERETAYQFATDKRIAKDDITLGETGTTVYFVKLAKVGSSDTVTDSIHFDAPMTESRAFGAARRACDFDILPYASEQQRECKFLARAKFFELAKPCEIASEDEETDE